MRRNLACLLPGFVFVLALASAGCMRLGPDYSRPDAGFTIPPHFLSGKPAETAAYVPQDRWWQAFGDSGLNRVVSTVVKNNPDIAQAAAGVMEARATLVQTGAEQYPSLNLNAQAATQEQQYVNPITRKNETVAVDTYSLSLPASFELDLWGRLARASQAARAELLAAEQNRRTVVQSLVAEAVNLYLRIRFLQRQIDITENMVSSYKQNLELVEARYQRGLTSVLDVHQARRSLARAESELPSLIEARGKARHSLSILQGKYPENSKQEETQTREFYTPPPVPAGLPAELLNRRPDIRSAEAALEAACARIGVARASRFPQITLTGSFGYTSEELETLFDPESQLWKLAAGGVQPLFDAGRRAAAERAARARYEKQLASYAKTVLNAFAEVEDALLARQQLLKRRNRLVHLRSEAEATLKSALDRYQRGLTPYLNVLDARQSVYQARLDLAEAEHSIYSNRVKLHRALGGGWDRID
ncbi:MAG: efflux transporter outer membrane subunit [Desulfobacteraceae bacterium]|nr:efflux transporter outer membrane subunit [Desulfobacteraceae bacterium]